MGRKYDMSESCIRDWRKQTKCDIQRKIVVVGHVTSRKRGIWILKKAMQLHGDKRQYGCAVTSEMCLLKALAITKELGIMNFKATLRLCQVTGGKWVPTWLVSGIGTAWQRPTMHSPRTPLWPLLA